MHKRQLQHFILTRFNLLLWQRDKEGQKVRTMKWLDHRFTMFERFCLPSIKSQTCQDFEWIVLLDSMTPDRFKNKIAEYQKDYPQFVPVYFEPENGHLFPQIFRDEVVKRLTAKRVITSYLDNDDALNVRYVEDVQQRASSVSDGTFINYTDGCQYFSDYGYMMRIRYPRNHFVSLVEGGDHATVKTVFRYGGHYCIAKIDGVKIEHVKNLPMWCEVIHERNMGNDAYFIGAKMLKDKKTLRKNYGIDETVKYGIGIYLCRFIPRYCKTFVRRTKYYFFGRHW